MLWRGFGWTVWIRCVADGSRAERCARQRRRETGKLGRAEGGGGAGEAGTGRTQLGSLLEATGSSEKCPDCVKLRHPPLDNEYKVRIIINGQVMVPDAIPDVATSYVKLEEDEASSGCEGFGCNSSTSLDNKVETKRVMQHSPSPTPSKRRRDQDSRLHRLLDLVEKKSRKDSEEIDEIAQMLEIVIEDGAEKGSVVYSYATQLFKKKEIRDMFSIFLKQDGRLEWLKRTWDPVRWEIRRMMRMVLEDGAKVGSDEYFYASQLCMKKEYRDVFTTLKTPTARLEWIKRTWEEQKKH